MLTHGCYSSVHVERGDSIRQRSRRSLSAEDLHDGVCSYRRITAGLDHTSEHNAAFTHTGAVDSYYVAGERPKAKYMPDLIA